MKIKDEEQPELIKNLYSMMANLSERVYALEGIIKDNGVGLSAPEKKWVDNGT
tara:strand:+ start:631 stop:789 length:159 start_codon:yes stop_codon:yes gene_type:complete